MVLLLDTHVLLWTLDAPERPPQDVAAQLESPEEIAQAARDTGLAEWPVSAAHGAKVAHLPRHRRDPFDRPLIAQALLAPASLPAAGSAFVSPVRSWCGSSDPTP